MIGLIVTADDFGATIEVNEAVEIAHQRGVLTAASLMVSGPAISDAVRRARQMPSLRVGLHIVLVEGRSILSPSSIPLLVDEHGVFGSNMVSLGCLLAYNARARRQLAAEITAQFEAFRDTGLTLDHCNAHKHFHLHPAVSDLLLTIGARFGVKSIRVPIEDRRVLSAIERISRGGVAWLMWPVADRLRRRVRAAGMYTTDRVFGLEWSGQMSKDRLLGLIENLPSGVSEIYLHPATDRYEGCAPQYRYRDELNALIDADVLAACRSDSIKLGGFGDFAPNVALLKIANPHQLPSSRPVSR